MYIHEYQAKDLLQGYGVRVPRGGVAHTAAEALEVARELGDTACMVKAQIHAGGRGKAGGIRAAGSHTEATDIAQQMLGSSLVTYQTGAAGKTVKAVYVEEQVATARELYLAVLVDRGLGRVALIASADGGEDIEETAQREPDKIRKLVIDPAEGFQDEAARTLAGDLGLDGGTALEAVELMAGITKAFVELDASLIEINPLAVTEDGRLIAVDVKMGFDDNALFRHPEVDALRDVDEHDPSELEAARYELNYVKLDGTIGCMVNGAGLALSTLDMIKQYGGEPADFMDVRPVATRQQVATGFKMILRNPQVRAILLNMFGGGIQRCDTIAEGVAAAVREEGLRVPLIVRAAGTNCEIGMKALVSQGVPAVFADDLADAALKVVEAAKREAV